MSFRVFKITISLNLLGERWGFDLYDRTETKTRILSTWLWSVLSLFVILDVLY
jgi:hypothetical protein